MYDVYVNKVRGDPSSYAENSRPSDCVRDLAPIGCQKRVLEPVHYPVSCWLNAIQCNASRPQTASLFS
jgi:hypothetical protein